MISSELLTVVKGEGLILTPFNQICNRLDYSVGLEDAPSCSHINIYELMHLVKRWARDEGYEIGSIQLVNGGASATLLDSKNKIMEAITVNSECEAVYSMGEVLLNIIGG